MQTPVVARSCSVLCDCAGTSVRHRIAVERPLLRVSAMIRSPASGPRAGPARAPRASSGVVGRGRRRASLGLLIVSLSATTTDAARAETPAGSADPRVLFVLAHPDDETLAGGVLGRLRERDIDVSAVVVTRGENGKVVTGIGEADLIEREPSSPAALARRRGREMERAARFHGLSRLYWLSSSDDTRYVDEWNRTPAGETRPSRWNTTRLQRELSAIVDEVRPTVVITLNPRADHVHPQHRLLGELVEHLGRTHPELAGRASVYGMREQDWYGASTPDSEDLELPRNEFSAVLGRTYGAYLQAGAAHYASQSSHARYVEARAKLGLLPGYQENDVLKPLSLGPESTQLQHVLSQHEPHMTLRRWLSPKRFGRVLRRRIERAWGRLRSSGE